MSKARNIADLLDANGDVALGNLDNVPPSNDASALTTGTLPVDRVPYVGRRNLIINGAMQVAQRGTSETGVTSSFLVDRWKVQTDTTATYEQVTDAPSGFSSSLKVTNTGTSSSSGAYREIRYVVEAHDLASSGWDYTNSSSNMSFSFWVKSSIAQTMSVLFRVDDTATNKYFSRQFTINSANTWEYKTMTIFGDSGITVDNNNGRGLTIFILPFYGSGYASASSDGVWASSSANAVKTFNQTWATTLNSTIKVTGVQLERGSVATPFEHRSYGEELALCQRYYVDLNLSSLGLGNAYTTNAWVYQEIPFPVRMRATPSIAYTGGSGGTWASNSNLRGVNANNHDFMNIYGKSNAATTDYFISGAFNVQADAEL